MKKNYNNDGFVFLDNICLGEVIRKLDNICFFSSNILTDDKLYIDKKKLDIVNIMLEKCNSYQITDDYYIFTIDKNLIKILPF